MRSKRLSAIAALPEPVFFVDRNLGAAKMPALLRLAGFRIEVHDDIFHKQQNIHDIEIIDKCGQEQWLLLTADSDLPSRYCNEIKAAKIGVFCQTNNNYGPDIWGPIITNAKKRIMKAAQKRERPFVVFVTMKGELNFRKGF